jgi:hypothetical protein
MIISFGNVIPKDKENFVFKIFTVFLLAAMTTPAAWALSCKLKSTTPTKIIDRCGTTRNYGGEVNIENLDLNGSSYSIENAPQTYQYLYTYECEDECGNTINILGDVQWDCVAPQEIAGVALEAPLTNNTRSSCHQDPIESSSFLIIDHFNSFLRHRFIGGIIKPWNMPHSQKGINYWSAENQDPFWSN